MGACPRECVPKLRVTEPLLCTKTFIPFYPNTLPGVPKPSRASRAPSSVIISLGWSRGATTRLENRLARKGHGGLNPSSSASKLKTTLKLRRFFFRSKRANVNIFYHSFIPTVSKTVRPERAAVWKTSFLSESSKYWSCSSAPSGVAAVSASASLAIRVACH